MPTARGVKRKANGTPASDPQLSVPDRTTWSGWVEIESEPALFNVMIKDMGVRGIKFQELYSIEDVELAILPQPVHALVFLFKYNSQDEQIQEAASPPSDLWFANQIPDFACATVALMNIVNNIPGISLGKELQGFKEATAAMDPMSRGDAIDKFTFVRRIHNSFASESELLAADMHVKNKLAKFKRRQAALKGNATKAARKAAAQAAALPGKRNASTPPKSGEGVHLPETMVEREIAATPSSSALSEPPMILEDMQATEKTLPFVQDQGEETSELRRSKRQLKPRQANQKHDSGDSGDDDDDGGGYHFVAYMPVRGRVWKMDGLNSFPQDLGPNDKGEASGDEQATMLFSTWLRVAQPWIMERMAQFDGSHSFNLMAVVHDPIAHTRQLLLINLAAMESITKRLDSMTGNWKSHEAANLLRQPMTRAADALDASDLGFEPSDLGVVSTIHVEAKLAEQITNTATLEGLLQLRKAVASQQFKLIDSLQVARDSEARDTREAQYWRHDYGMFVRQWMQALADEGLLASLVEM